MKKDNSISINNDEYEICYFEPTEQERQNTEAKKTIGINCYLKDKKSGEIIDPQNIKRNVSCPVDEDYHEHLEQKSAMIADVLIYKMKARYPKLINKGELATFSQFYEKKYPKIEQLYCWAPSTIAQYRRNIRKIEPKLDSKPLCYLTLNDYEVAVDELKKEKGKEFSKERIDQFWSNLCSVADFAVFCKICTENPIGKCKKLNPIKKAIDERQKRKSLNTDEISKVSNLLIEGFNKTDMALGTALQLFLGLRTAEACGPNFRDVKYYADGSGRCYLLSYTQNRSSKTDDFNKYTAQKKTVNGYRLIPIPKELQLMIELKHKYLIELGFSEEEIEDMPLVSTSSYQKAKSGSPKSENMKESLMKRCNSDMLGKYGGDTLYKVLNTRSYVEIPLEEIRSEDEKAACSLWEKIESDSQAYSLRRNFVTNMYGICGFEQDEVENITGHALDDIRHLPTDYTSEESLQKRQKKMDRLIYIPISKGEEKASAENIYGSSDPREHVETIICDNGIRKRVEIEDEVQRRYVIQPSSPDCCVEVSIVLEGEEPADRLFAEIESKGTMSNTVTVSDAPREKLKDTVNVTSFYYEDIFDKTPTEEEMCSSDEEDGEGDSESKRNAYLQSITEEIADYEKNIDVALETPKDINNDEESDDETDE